MFGMRSLLSSVILIFFVDPIVGAFERDELKADCGRAVSRVRTRGPGELVPSALGSSPWHTVVYKVPQDKSNNWELACSGNIVAPDIVITAASCVFVEFKRVFHNASTFRVVAAKMHLSLNRDVENSQLSEVKAIKPHPDYTGEISVHTDNLAVLVVDPPFMFNAYVGPVCIDWDGKKTQLASSTTTNIAGWGLRRGSISEVLQEGSFTTVQNRQCRNVFKGKRLQRYINYDKFCIMTPSVTEINNSFAGRKVEDSGSGTVINVGGKHYLQGILSAYLGDNLTVATNITNAKHRKWLMGTLTHVWEQKKCQDGFLCDNNVCISKEKKCDRVSDCADRSDESEETCRGMPGKGQTKHGTCVLPLQQSGVAYRIESCEEDSCFRLPGTAIGAGVKVMMKCGAGTEALDPLSRYACVDGDWFPTKPTCVRMCPPRIKRGVDVHCEHQRAAVNCSDHMSLGTLATAKCQRLHKIKDPLQADERSKCLESGRWSTELPTCVPECGLPNNLVDEDTAEPTITFGRNATYGKYPWHIALYLRNRKTDAPPWEHICGGTIITQNLVLTAAHCLQDLKAEDLLVAGGRVLRDLKETERFQQTSLITEKFVPELYEDFVTHYEYDIAMLGLATPFKITNFVLPCCLDFLTPVSSFLQKARWVDVVGWGLTQNKFKPGGVSSNPSPVLKETKVAIVQTQECRKLDRNFTVNFTFDKFCGFYNKGSGPQKGDSGGGVVMETGGLYYLVGVVSVKPRDSNLFAAFTNVGVHRDWIKEIIRKQKT